MKFLQSILKKPLEVRLKEGVFSSHNATLKREPGTMLKTVSPVDRMLFLKLYRYSVKAADLPAVGPLASSHTYYTSATLSVHLCKCILPSCPDQANLLNHSFQDTASCGLLSRPFVYKTINGRSPTWEYDSLHPRLKLSDDRLVVSCHWRIFYPCGPQRFDKLRQVLSRDAFLSGNHYWEADLLHAGAGWWVGAAYPSTDRKGDSESCRLGWNRASWFVKKFDLDYWAFHNAERIPLRVEDDPDCIGIFLDYEAGILSFYNVADGMTHLHTFHCKFTEPVNPALRLWEGSIGIWKLT